VIFAILMEILMIHHISEWFQMLDGSAHLFCATTVSLHASTTLTNVVSINKWSCKQCSVPLQLLV